MSRMMFLIPLLAAQMFFPAASWAESWCTLESGDYKVVSHGVKGPKVWILGNFVGQTSTVWIPIKDATHGESSVSIALAAQLAGKNLAVYLDGANDTCANYSNWNGVIRHVRLEN